MPSVAAASRAMAVLAGVWLVLAPTRSLAQSDSTQEPTRSAVYILALSTDDADDEADALTRALRGRVRQSDRWTLSETSQSFDTLAIALRCPPRPDAACLGRIGDQLRA